MPAGRKHGRDRIFENRYVQEIVFVERIRDAGFFHLLLVQQVIVLGYRALLLQVVVLGCDLFESPFLSS